MAKNFHKVFSAMNCPDCQSGKIVVLGKIISSRFFGGKFIDFDFPQSSLYRCTSCHLKFKHPIVDEMVLNDLYRNVDGDTWSHNSRNDFKLVQEKLREIGVSNIRILDVGCNRGDLLSVLPKHVSRFGIEPNIKQHSTCLKNGFKNVWPSLAEVIKSGQVFDVITMTDVIEHIKRPTEFLEGLLKCLRPGGSIIITTGNSESFLWKLFSQNNWYPFYQEHISFICPKWINSFSINHELEIPEIHNFSYLNHDKKTYAKHLIMTAVLGLSPLLYQLIFRILGYKKNELFPFGYGLTKDHLMARIIKK